MSAPSQEPRRASTQEEIKPLLDYCKAGDLFAVQDWIASGKPIDSPRYPNQRVRRRSALETAIKLGFHSLVKVLLEGGATIESTGYEDPMDRALQMRRFDLVQLLVMYGYDVKSVSMGSAFSTWDPEVMEYFIDRGADVELGNPLASALCARVRTALRILKRYKDQFPSFQEQANIALRHHCKEGNVKWVSLMIWAGADPYAPGTEDPSETLESGYDGLSALGFAALYGHYEVFRLKGIRIDADHPALRDVVRYADSEGAAELVRMLLEKGMHPNDQENGGCSAIQSLISRVETDLSRFMSYHNFDLRREGVDSHRSRERIRIVHLLAKYGGRWLPKDSGEINDARRALLKLTPDYTVEFIWIMAKYKASSRQAIEQLVRTPTIKKHTQRHAQRIAELVAKLE